MIHIKNAVEVEYIRKANRIIAQLFEAVKPYMKPGVTTGEIDAFAEDFIRSRGALPSFKGYTPGYSIPPYPSATCISINEQVIHGIPGVRVLAEGDLVKLDVGTIFSGYFGDATMAYEIGTVAPEVKRLSDDTRRALELAIDVCREGNYLNEIGRAVSFYLSPRGYGIIRDYCGHGVGKAIHEEPPIVNYYDAKRKGPRLKAGMVLAIEPMITLGGYRVKCLDDQWTVVTTDGSIAAHWEHSIVVTDGSPEILSLP